MSRLNLKQLKADVDRRRKERPEGVGPGGRRVSGSMQLIRDNLADIEELHAGGATWVDIAAGLAAQGVTQGDGEPITGKRLTSLIASIRRQDARRQAIVVARAARADIVAANPSFASEPARLRLSPDFSGVAAPIEPTPTAPSEEDLRRSALDRAKLLTKKG